MAGSCCLPGAGAAVAHVSVHSKSFGLSSWSPSLQLSSACSHEEPEGTFSLKVTVPVMKGKSKQGGSPTPTAAPLAARMGMGEKCDFCSLQVSLCLQHRAAR